MFARVRCGLRIAAIARCGLTFRVAAFPACGSVRAIGRAAAFADIGPDQIEYSEQVARIQRGGGFVCNKKRRLGRKCTSTVNARQFSSRERARRPTRQMRQVARNDSAIYRSRVASG